jgi:hypothetical protein
MRMFLKTIQDNCRSKTKLTYELNRFDSYFRYIAEIYLNGSEQETK